MKDERVLKSDIARSDTELTRGSTLSLEVRHARAVMAAEIMANMLRQLRRRGSISDGLFQEIMSESTSRLSNDKSGADGLLMEAGIASPDVGTRGDLLKGATAAVGWLTDTRTRRPV